MTLTSIYSVCAGSNLIGMAGERSLKNITHAWYKCVQTWNKHSDLISSAGILAVTTCLLAEKIFQNFPPVIPRLGRVFLNFTGVISMNMQIRDCWKSGEDLLRSCKDGDRVGMVQTAAKTFVKGVNVLLTAAFFGASMAALSGFPQVALGVYQATRTFALTSLTLGILGDIWDFYTNEGILHSLQKIDEHKVSSREIAKFMRGYFQVILNKQKAQAYGSSGDFKEYALASRLVRQLDYQTIQSFKEKARDVAPEEVRQEAFKRFDAARSSLLNRQSWTKSNLTLLVLGYLSMAACRAYPDSLIEMSARWGMSVLYTDELIRYKLFQSDITCLLANNS